MKRSRRFDPDATLKKQRKAFKKKFGRDPQGGDPVFFDPDADTPIPLTREKVEGEVLSAMKTAGLPADVIYAFRKTGMLVMESRLDEYDPVDLASWNAAIEEYRRLEAEQAKTDTIDPPYRTRVIPPTKLPELVESPFTAADEEAISRCLDALDSVMETTSMTVRARMELGVGLLALACDHAFDSRVETGGTVEEGHRFAISIGQLGLARTQEIYEGMDHGSSDDD